MDELIDILDPEGNPIGKTALKSEVHKKGLYHHTVHIWFYTADGNVLLQQRGKAKETHPLLWDVSVAGHIGAGEEIETAAIRETEEEIGLKITESDLKKIGVFKSFYEHREGLMDNELHHTFACELIVSLEQLEKQVSEVENLKLISILNFQKELKDKERYKMYVPHEMDYFSTILKEIKGIR